MEERTAVGPNRVDEASPSAVHLLGKELPDFGPNVIAELDQVERATETAWAAAASAGPCSRAEGSSATAAEEPHGPVADAEHPRCRGVDFGQR